MDDPTAFGPRLRAAREAAGMSLRDLSFPGCSPSYISRLENGSRLPSLQLVNALAARLGVRSEDLLGTPTEQRLEEQLTDAEVALRLGDVETARSTFTAIAEDATGDAKALALGGLAELHAADGETDEAIELLERARELLGPSFSEHPSLVRTLGTLRSLRGEYDEAISLFAAGREAALARGDRTAALRLTLLAANTYIDLGSLPQSAEHLAAALAEADAIGDHDLRARTLWSQSRLHTIEGRHELAAEFARRALSALEASEDELSIARAKQLLAYIEAERGAGEVALSLLEEAVPIVERTGNAQERALILLEQARVLVQLERFDEARELAIEIAPVVTRSARADSGRCFTTLGDVWTAVGNEEAALGMYDAAIDALDGHRSPWLATACKRKAALLEANGDEAGALALLKRAVDVESSTAPRSV
jgi:tetratricopeptide (TPR) repeat protein